MEQLELIKSIINYPSYITILKFNLIYLIQSIINLSLTYPINIILFISIITFLIYKILNTFFADKSFRLTYKPLQHKINLLNDVKSVKK